MMPLTAEGNELGRLLEIVASGPRDSFADIGGNALDLALAIQARWDSAIYLIDMVKSGDFAQSPSAWVTPYLAALERAGADMSRVEVIASAGELPRLDVIANLRGFGDRSKVKHLKPVMERCLHADSRLITDIKKGSGSFPFFKEFGSCELLWSGQMQGVERSRVLFTPNMPISARNRTEDDDFAGAWADIARTLAGTAGFYRENPEHSFLFIQRDPTTLIVTFDNLDIAMGKRDDRRPWGFGFIEKQGWSMLGVMANGWTWYRDPWVWAEFDRLEAEGFFARFDRVVFYGASMGGYAACAFSVASPGCDVVAISPQSTLDKSVVPWETRYKTAWDRDFTGRYGDAAMVSRTAGRVAILFDPYEPLDKAHAERFTLPNAVFLRAPLLGHRLGSSLAQMGILTPIILGAIQGRLEPIEFYRILRARHDFPRYQRELFLRVIDRGRPELARRVGNWVLRNGDNRFIRQRLAKL
jgi:hypothetical protein